MRTFRQPKIILSALVLPLALIFSSLQAEVTDADLSGLKLAKETEQVKIYVKSGTDISQYKSLYLATVAVSVDQDWLQDYNRERKSLNYRLNKSDVERLTNRYAKKFKEVATNAIANEASLNMQDSMAKAQLKVETAIVNLKLYAPDKTTAIQSTYMVRQAGRAELHTKMFDAKSGELIVAIIDKKETREYHDLFQTNRVRNQFEFLPVYKTWAKNWVIGLQQ